MPGTRLFWYELLQVLVPCVFVFAFGACVGSLVNVLVYRLPRGLGVVTPPSRCPRCETRLTWRENIPIVGWLRLGGRCRFCRSRISAEYPIVEAVVAVLFVLVYLTLYVLPAEASWLGVEWGRMRPEWGRNGFVATWPAFIVLLVMVSCLVASTLVDAKTATIPLVLTWTPAGLALVAHPLHAWWIGAGHGPWGLPLRHVAEGWWWTIPTPGPESWRWIGAGLGGGLGVLAANGLLASGLVRRSFADYEAWEREARASSGGEGGAGGSPSEPSAEDAQMWIQYPHARREMLRELVFLAPVVVLAIAGWALAGRLAGPWVWDASALREVPAARAPLWLMVLSGVLLGYLIGGGVIGAVRILGTLAFGKVAMGLGDVHLMAGVGACLGWIDPTLALFLAPFPALAWIVGGVAVSGGKPPRAMPFGPWLAAGTLLVLWGKPLIESGLGRLVRLGSPLDLP